uniref:Signal peptidase complex-like protein DTM1 n=1 Tax=Rhizophora mucronata TaxID=61149 RepID=A0A2P2IZG6_RHIMU
MANDAALRTSLVWLAAVMVVSWIYTKSFKKTAVTYVVGALGIAGVLLPDWDYFDRDYSRWFSPVTEEEKVALAQRSGLMFVSLFLAFCFPFSPLPINGFSELTCFSLL